MKVVLIRSRYNPFGGAERFIENALGALTEADVELTVITRKWPTNANANIRNRIVDPFYLGSWWRDAGFAKAVCAALAEEKFDLVQSHERIACCDVYRAGDGVHAEWLAQRKRVTSLGKQLSVKLNPHHRFLLSAERELFTSPRLKAVICNSEMVKGEIERHFGTAPEKLRVIRNAVDADKFHPGLKEAFRKDARKTANIRKAAPTYLFVGSGFERKGLVAFLIALADLPDNARGIVVGADKRLVAFQAYADQLGLTDRVYFTGGVEDVLPWYAAADVFVLPTLYDPLPNAVLEAMACGLPAITSPTCGAAELIEEGKEGFVRDAIDGPAYADAMQRAYDNREVMGAAARERVLPFTPQRMAAEYVALYRELLGLAPG
ncbi:MAG: glycosyltransferase family 4 protein [Betaproteobacteria bacterium]|nr:glycosyltransferase family 4 protein [Betaproteobacteria bacterium]